MIELPEWMFGNDAIVFVQEMFGLGHPLPFRAFSLLGDTWGIILVVGLSLWLFGRRAMYSVIGIVVVGAALKLLLTDIFAVPRPSGAEIVVYDRLEIGSFPSGHVFEAVGPWGQLYALGCVALWITVAITVLVAVGRIYLGAHYLADVVAGAFLGVLLVWAYARLWPAILRWFSERSRGFHLTLAAGAITATIALMVTMGGNARRFEIYGMVIGAGIALPLMHRWVGGAADDGGWRVRLPKILIGGAGITLFLLWDRSQSDQALLLGTITAGLATLWAVLVAPALFSAAGLGGVGSGDTRPAGGRYHPEEQRDEGSAVPAPTRAADPSSRSG